MPTVFISHSSLDVEIARALKARLGRVGLTGFMAPDDMRGSADWPQQLSDAVEGCAAMVLLYSSSANESGHVAREVSIAVNHSRPILALRLDSTPPSGSLGYLLQLQQWIDVFPGPLESYLENVLAELRSMLATAAAAPARVAGGDRPGLCPNCGAQNPGEARFCSTCSALLPGALLGALGRRVVTVLECELTGSAGGDDVLDPEASHRLLTQFVGEARRVVVLHGGIVEHVTGPVVRAVFGLPTLHEDDALRAARASVELQQATGLRVGIATGEVVSGDPATSGGSITGSVLQAAARLRDSARPGQILMDASTQDLVRDAVEAEVQPGTGVFRLVRLDASAAAHARRLDAPMVGRERELRGLRHAFDDAISDRSCHLFTILGAAGVGKSRLVAEFLADVAGEARTLGGRCLPYGEGITYWPVREVVHAAADIDDGDTNAAARAKLSALLADHRDAPEIERTVARAVGLSDEAVTPEELTWGVQRFLEVLAEDRPVVLVLDDIQWAEPTLLDLIEHITDWVRDAPLLVVCPARPELLEARPGWGGGKLNASSVLLAPLPTEAAHDLIEALGGAGLPEGLQAQIAASAEGNPLFIEEMINMLRADGVLDDRGRLGAGPSDVASVRVPPTIRALLAARLDQLVPDERTVAERASVIGRAFEQGAVAELSPEGERPELRLRLLGLVRKELLRLDRTAAADDAYQFRHLLIRDAAYDALPKAERAVLHEHFARWLIGVSGDRISEYEEVVAFHLAEAHRWRLDLGERGDVTSALASEAGDWYARAASRAAAILDSQSARPLWERAVALLDQDGRAWLEATYALAIALDELGDGEAAQTGYASILERATERDPALAVMARIGVLLATRATNAAWVDEMQTLIQESLPVLAEAGDERYLSSVHFVLAETLGASHPDALAAARAAVIHGRQSGDPQARRVAATGFVQTVVRLPPDEARKAIAEYVDQGDIVGAARIFYLIDMAHLEAKDGNLSTARAQLAEAIELAERFAQPELLVGACESAARKARWDGDFDAAAGLFRRALDVSERFNLTYWAPKLEAWLALSLFDLHQEDAAAELLARRAGLAGEDELADLIGSLPQARLLGRRGRADEALAALNAAIEQMPPMAVLLRTEGRVEAIRMLREAGLDEAALEIAARARTDIETAPAPLYTSMIGSALAWPLGFRADESP